MFKPKSLLLTGLNVMPATGKIKINTRWVILHTNWLQSPVVSTNRPELLKVLFPLHQVMGHPSSFEYLGEF